MDDWDDDAPPPQPDLDDDLYVSGNVSAFCEFLDPAILKLLLLC
jgi:hypothetical protein